MDHKITKKLLKLVGNPNATTDQLMAGIELMDRMAAEDARARAAQPQHLSRLSPQDSD